MFTTYNYQQKSRFGNDDEEELFENPYLTNNYQGKDAEKILPPDEVRLPAYSEFYHSKDDNEPFFISTEPIDAIILDPGTDEDPMWLKLMISINGKKTVVWYNKTFVYEIDPVIIVTGKYELPDEKAIVATWDLTILGNLFTARVVYEANHQKTEKGYQPIDQMLVLELYYAGNNGFSDKKPMRFPIRFDASVIGDQIKRNPYSRMTTGMYPDEYTRKKYAYYSIRELGNNIAGDIDLLFTPKHELAFFAPIGVAQKISGLTDKKKEFDLGSYSFDKFTPNPDVTYTAPKSLVLNDKNKVTYFIIGINKIFGESLSYESKNGHIKLLVIDQLSSDNDWVPAATVHNFSVIPFVTVYESSGSSGYANHTYYSTPDNHQNFSKGELNEDLIKSIAFQEMSKEDMMIVPEGSIRSDQNNLLKNKQGASGTGNFVASKKSFQLPASTALTVTKILLEEYNSQYLLNKSEAVGQVVKTINKDLKTVNSLEKQGQPVDSYGIKANDYHEMLSGALSQLKILDELLLDQKDKKKKDFTSDEQKYKALEDEIRTLYRGVIEKGYYNISSLKQDKLKADKKLIYLKDLKAAKLLQYGGEVFTNFYFSHKVYITIKEALKPKGFFSHIFYKMDNLSSDLRSGVTKAEKDFFHGEKQELEEAQLLSAKVSVFSGIVNALSIFFALWQLEEMDDADWLRLFHGAGKDSLLETYYNECKKQLDFINLEFKKGYNPDTPPDMDKIILALKVVNQLGAKKGFVEFLKGIQRGIEKDIEIQGWIVEALILIVGFLLAEFGGMFLAAAARGALLGTRAVQIAEFTGQVLGFAATSYTAKVIGGDKEASFLAEVRDSALMLGFLRLTSYGVQRVFIKKYGQITEGVLKNYEFAATMNGIVSLHFYAELSTKIKTGEWMSSDERIRALLMNVIAVKALMFTHKLLVQPLNNKLIDGLINNNRIGNLSNIKNARILMLEKSNQLAEKATILEKTGELPDHYYKLLEQAKNAEIEFLEAAKKGVNESDLRPVEKERFLKAIEKEINAGLTAVRQIELQLAQEGLNLPLRYYTEGMEFYALGHGEVGFKASALEFLKKTYADNKGTFTEQGSKTGIYKGTVNGETIIYIHEKAIDGKLNLKDPAVKEGYEQYKKDNNLTDFFEVAERLSDKRFEKLDDFFIEYKKSTDLRRNVQKLPKSLSLTYHKLVEAGCRTFADGGDIKIISKAGTEIAVISGGKFIVKKWMASYKGEVILKLEEGYQLIKQGDELGFEIGFKEMRQLTAEDVNMYHKEGRGANEPYMPITMVGEVILKAGDIIFVVEYKNQEAPGMWASKEKITTLAELREKIAVLKEWKNEDVDEIVVREYRIVSDTRVRDGEVGPQLEETGSNKGKMYEGGGHQYELLEGRFNKESNPYEKFMIRTGNEEVLK